MSKLWHHCDIHIHSELCMGVNRLKRNYAKACLIMWHNNCLYSLRNSTLSGDLWSSTSLYQTTFKSNTQMAYWSSKLQENNEEKNHPCWTNLCAFSMFNQRLHAWSMVVRPQNNPQHRSAANAMLSCARFLYIGVPLTRGKLLCPLQEQSSMARNNWLVLCKDIKMYHQVMNVKIWAV